MNAINTTEYNFYEELSDMWSLLDDDEKYMLVNNCTLHRYKKNEMIYREDERPMHMMCLIKGKVKIFKEGVGGRSQIMRLMRPVQYFGYRAYFADENYLTGAAAFEDAEIVFIPMTIIEVLLKQNSMLSYYFIKILSMDLGVSDARTVSLTQKHIRGRLAESLIFLKDAYGTDVDGVTLNILIAREDLANLSNMTTSNAIRTLSVFANEKIIAVDGRRIKFLDENKLLKISKFG